MLLAEAALGIERKRIAAVHFLSIPPDLRLACSVEVAELLQSPGLFSRCTFGNSSGFLSIIVASIKYILVEILILVAIHLLWLAAVTHLRHGNGSDFKGRRG